jgi:hypothetical protein
MVTGFTFFDFVRGSPQSFLREFGNVSGPANFIAKRGGTLLIFLRGIKRLRELNKDEPSISSTLGI